MKVLLLNGSAHKEGCTFTALSEIAKTLNEQGVETEIYQLGNVELKDCSGCGACRKLGKCVINDIVNEFVEKARGFDGFVFGTPVYYAHPSGRILSFLDRAFYSGKSAFEFKPACAIAYARRAGTDLRRPSTKREALALEKPSLDADVGILINARFRKKPQYFAA